MTTLASRLVTFVNAMFGRTAADGYHAEAHGASWTIFSGAMIFGGRQPEH